MNEFIAIFQKVFAIGCGVLLLAFVVWIVKRCFIERKPIPPGVAGSTRTQLMNVLNADQQAGLEHQIYMEEDERCEDEQGDRDKGVSRDSGTGARDPSK